MFTGPERCDNGLVMWLPFEWDSVREGNGMVLARGSHRWGTGVITVSVPTCLPTSYLPIYLPTSYLPIYYLLYMYLQGGPKKVCSQKTKIGYGGVFFEKKTMTNKIKKFLYTL